MKINAAALILLTGMMVNPLLTHAAEHNKPAAKSHEFNCPVLQAGTLYERPADVSEEGEVQTWKPDSQYDPLEDDYWWYSGETVTLKEKVHTVAYSAEKGNSRGMDRKAPKGMILACHGDNGIGLYRDVPFKSCVVKRSTPSTSFICDDLIPH